MFDFPASPAIGDISNGYRFDGVGWAGGPIVATPQEQTFNLAGKTSIDVDVPTWAKGAVLDGSVFVSVAAAYAGLQVSVDGSTFYAGTSYQLMGGIIHNVSGGYATQAAGASPHLYIDYPRSNLLVPHIFQTQLSLESNSTNQLITARSEMQQYDNSSLQSNLIWGSYLNVNLTPPARVQKLRVFCSGGSFINGYVKIRWIGADVPQTNGLVPEAPLDGGEYVRVNGVWRLKKQQFDVASGATQLDIPVPTSWNPMMARLTWFIGHAGATGSGYGLIMRCSLDGTTFPAASADYYNSGVTGQGSPTGSVSMSIVTAYTYAFLDYGGENTSVGHQGVAEVSLQRLPNSVWEITSRSTCYSNAAGVAHRVMMMTNYLSGAFASAPANARLKAMRMLLVGGQAMGDGRVVAEWL